MSTSDAAYLQSVYELAFLPRLTAFNAGESMGGDMGLEPDNFPDDYRSSFNECFNHELMWRTYSTFKIDANKIERDSFEDLGFESDGGGAKINPYGGTVRTQNLDDRDPNVDPTHIDASPLMAVFANTPESWWAASANTSAGVEDRNSASEFNKKYAFSQTSDTGNMTMLNWNDLCTKSDEKQDMKDLPIAENFRYELWKAMCMAGAYDDTQGGDSNWDIDEWENVYDDLWGRDNNDPERLMGARLRSSEKNLKLFNVDRQFLYGYWRDCFAVKQQLFLIFVRAEPAMMGGGAIRQTPPQLGARAVALVWRNPYRSSKSYMTTADTDDNSSGLPVANVPDNAPHQTRVLFYRQFD